MKEVHHVLSKKFDSLDGGRYRDYSDFANSFC
jgi:hypothetical protein